MANRKHRQPIQEDMAAQVLFLSDRTCCVCRDRKKSVQIHHIDENPGNNTLKNLAVLCFDCHRDTQIRGGFDRKLDSAQVARYRDDWHQVVEQRRKEKQGSDSTAIPIKRGCYAELGDKVKIALIISAAIVLPLTLAVLGNQFSGLVTEIERLFTDKATPRATPFLVVSDINFNHSGTMIAPGETVNLWINFSASGSDLSDLEFNWSAERGMIIDAGAPDVTYTAPTSPGGDTVRVEVRSDVATIERSISFEVLPAIVTATTKTVTSTPTPTSTPTTTSTPSPTTTSTSTSTSTPTPTLTPTQESLPSASDGNKYKYSAPTDLEVSGLEKHPTGPPIPIASGAGEAGSEPPTIEGYYQTTSSDSMREFTWDWNGDLDEEEFFELRIWQPGGPHWGGAAPTKNKTVSVALDVLTGNTDIPTNRSDLRNASILCASVAVITADPYGSVSPESDPMCFAYQ